ncbi:MAG: Rrf2 family transcriptional regulator [Phycisphaerales bacterium]|nr:MAG: Rrf2 family transcriptional regulator [Phycisphaerales bacterium]
MLSITAEYALRIIVALAEQANGPLTSESIARTTQVPADYAVKVLQMLGRARLVRAQRGRGGGFRLACDPHTTTLRDVVRVIDPLRRVDTSTPIPAAPNGKSCPLHQRLDAIAMMVEKSLAEITIQSVVDDSGDSAPPRTKGPDGAADGRGRKGKTKKKSSAGRGHRRTR